MKKKSSGGTESTSHNSDGTTLDPVQIARARHVGQFEGSAQSSARQGNQSARKQQGGLFGELASCLVIPLLGLAFVTGGILGGIVGGGLILATNGSNQIALNETATPNLPTPVPAATLLPTNTPAVPTTPTVEDVIDHVTQAVVTVINKHLSAQPATMTDEGRVVGSGLIVDPRGYIATNNHVVENPGKLSVVLSDGREIEALLIAKSPEKDLALLKISLINLAIADWGDSTKLRPGQVVYALGSPLGDFPNSVSFGIISGLNRALEMNEHVIDRLIQTDAAINRGSSGGPLINAHGQVIGINTFIIRESEERGIAEGIAFAIPTETVKEILLPWINAHSAEAEAIPAGN